MAFRLFQILFSILLLAFNYSLSKASITNFEDHITKDKIVLESILIVDSNGDSIRPIIPTEVIRVGEDFRFIHLVFNTSSENKNHLKYQFTSFQDSWIDFTGHLVLSDLKLGKHTLIVNQAFESSYDELKVEIEIFAPFYRSRIALLLYIIIGGVFAILVPYQRFVEIRKSNKYLLQKQQIMDELSKQKEELTVKNKNITDSIHYAKRIQEAIIPSDNFFKRILPNSFIFYKPKDIVSGDFYWIHESEEKIFAAAVDCTGHGVPGAFMSIIGIELLRNITGIHKDYSAAQVLNELNRGVKEIFSLDRDNNPYVKDGMDVSLLVINKLQDTIQFSGALNIVYLVRDNKIIELKGERFSVGLAETEEQFYTDYDMKLETGDILYLFTDGYVDQFGGPDGKKYKYRRFRQLLLNIHNYPLDQQRELIQNNIEQWKGSLEQVDDILIIGIKPL